VLPLFRLQPGALPGKTQQKTQAKEYLTNLIGYEPQFAIGQARQRARKGRETMTTTHPRTMRRFSAETVREWFQQNQTRDITSTDLLSELRRTMRPEDSPNSYSIKALQSTLTQGWRDGWLKRFRSQRTGGGWGAERVMYRYRPDGTPRPAKPAVGAKVPTRPVLPENPTRAQYTEAINALQSWFAKVKTVSFVDAKAVMRTAGTCDQAQEFLREAGLPRVDRNSVYQTDETISSPATIIESHYTDEGLQYRWETLNAEVDSWLASARTAAAKQLGLSRVTAKAVGNWLAHIAQPPLTKVHRVTGSMNINWITPTQPPSNEELLAEVQAVLQKWAAAKDINSTITGFFSTQNSQG
jgi:hypothetical protein